MALAEWYDVLASTSVATPDGRGHNWTATTDPGATDDHDDGYRPGSLWRNTTTGVLWMCLVDTAAAASWQAISSGAESLHTDLSVSGAHTIDRGDGATHDLTLTGNATFTLAGALTGLATDIRVILRQDGTGSRTVTWPTISWLGGSAPTLQTGANAVDTIGLLSLDDGATWLGYHATSGGSAGTAASTVESETSFGITAAVGADTEYARQDHTHGSPANPVTAAAVKALGRWEPVQFDDGSSPWPFVYIGDEIVVAFIET